jgi:tetratricopeptide (TPR) repeat protein
LVLETSEGRPDLVPFAEVAELLRQSGRRLKLVVLSACLSAATSIEQTLSWLGEATVARQNGSGQSEPTATTEASEAALSVARGLVGKLNCAVLAMRYAVGDEFAMVFARELYDGLFRQRQSLPRAAQLALGTALGGNGAAAAALSVAMPALFGAKATDLELPLPRGLASGFAVPATGLAYFPQEPAHFVGRVTVMTRASAALAAEGQKSGVLFHGMAGAGKTSCAVELAYHHQAVGRFQAFVWHHAPEPDKDIQLALRDLALAMERQLPGFEMVHIVDRLETFKDWLPRITEWLENNAILVVLDNLESLLTDSGQWRDERWGMLIDALLTAGGLSRTVLTSRIRPILLPASTEIISVNPLPLDEALLLVRELPNLRRLLDGAAPGTSRDAGRQLVRRTLHLVQGHPKLIELAENLAADPQRLTFQLDRADAAPGADELDAFFRDGETRFDAAAFAASLRSWTTGLAGALPEVVRTFFHFLCALEEGDRESWVIEANWADLLKRLGRPEPAPGIAEVLAPLVAAGLVDRKAIGGDGETFEVLIHPGVAEAGRAEAGPVFQEAVDNELAATWRMVMQRGSEEYGKAPEAGRMIVRAGLAAFPYLSRRQEWALASAMLEQVDYHDKSPATVAAVLLRMRRVVEATSGTERELIDRGLLARLLLQAGRREEAEREMRAVIAQAENRNKFETASVIAGDLVNLLREGGRPEEALRVVEDKVEYTCRAGFGPWTQPYDEVIRLKILDALGENEEVLSRVMELGAQMNALPDPAGPNEAVATWDVRETMLDVGRAAAAALGRWQQALALGHAALQSKQERGASPLELAHTAFNDCDPLLRLGRYDDARALLFSCREVFERENAVEFLGRVFGAIADLEVVLHGPEAARRFADTSLRFVYITAVPNDIAIAHFRLATILKTQGSRSSAVAHLLAAALIAVLTGFNNLWRALRDSFDDLRSDGHEVFPNDLETLAATVERIEGVRFRDLISTLSAGGRFSGDQMLQTLISELGGRE